MQPHESTHPRGPHAKSDGRRPAHTMLELFRPHLGGASPGLRRWLEPVVAVCAVLALAALMSIGFVSFTLFMFVSGLMLLILTQVFGIHLNVQLPQAPR